MSTTALLVIDMLNSYEHDDADKLIPAVERIVEPLADLLTRARERDDVEVIYVNDNYGDFTSDFCDILDAACHGARPDLVDPIVPEDGTRHLLKVRHSAFYSTALGYLLGQLGVERVILTGQVTEQCVLYTALDAYVRHFEVVVVADAVAGIDAELADAALTMMHRNMKAELVEAADCLVSEPDDERR